ncbi:MAG: hypothetical protein AABY53_05530, partial [Bdellovibrionota bacterium]
MSFQFGLEVLLQDKKLINELKGTNEKLGPFRNPQVDGLIKKSTQLAQMEDIPGDVYQVIRSEL